MKLSGEYSKRQSRLRLARRRPRAIIRAPATAMSRTPCAVEAEDHAALRRRRRVVEVDDRAAARPRSASNVRRISGSRACVSTWTVTSSGMRSVLDQRADEVEVGLRGRREADLDLLEAHLDQQVGTAAACARRPSARSAPGCRRAGRRCTRPARASIVREGQRRSGSAIGVNGRYLVAGSVFMVGSRIVLRRMTRDDASPGDSRRTRRTARIEGVGLCAREAQQQQQAAREGRQRGERAAAGGREAAHDA